MSAAAGVASLAAATCPQCGERMEVCQLEAHYGQQVATDICPRCHFVWFDEFESVRLSGLGWVALLRRMQAAMAAGAGPMRPALACPRCGIALKPVHNLTRYGRFAALECPARHGHLHTFSLLLAERGLVRPMGRQDFQTLQAEGRAACCLNCGGPIDALSEQCSYCSSPLVVLDMPRLMTALLMRHAEPLPQAAADRVAWPCRGCGAPLAPSQMVSCDRCGHQVVVPSVLDLRPVLDRVEPLLRAALPREARPHGEKLRRMRGDHRATAAHGFLRHAWDMLQEGGGASGAIPTWVGLLLLAGAVWWFWF